MSSASHLWTRCSKCETYQLQIRLPNYTVQPKRKVQSHSVGSYIYQRTPSITVPFNLNVIARIPVTPNEGRRPSCGVWEPTVTHFPATNPLRAHSPKLKLEGDCSAERDLKLSQPWL